jgi:hypothetical protein
MSAETEKMKRMSRKKYRQLRNDPRDPELHKLWIAYTTAQRAYDTKRYRGYAEVDRQCEKLESETNVKYKAYRALKKQIIAEIEEQNE